MSYEIIGVRDYVKEPENHYLVIKKNPHSKGSLTEEVTVVFPKGRTTVCHEGRVYDWYGHEVVLPENVTRILYTFGSERDIGLDEDYFIVQLKGSRKALVAVDHRGEWDNPINVAGGHSRYSVTSMRTKFSESVGLRTICTFQNIDFQLLKDTPISTFCDTYPARWHDLCVLTKVKFTDLARRNDRACSIITSPGCVQMFFRIFGSKETLIATASRNDHEKASPDWHFYGAPIVSEDRQKVSICVPVYGKPTMISCDSETVAIYRDGVSVPSWPGWYVDDSVPVPPGIKI